MRALFDAIDDAVFVHDLNGDILEANPAACRRLGYARYELLNLNTRDIDAPDMAAGFQERLRVQSASGHLRFEGIHITKDGRRIPVDINTSAIDVGSRPLILAVMRDITDRKRAEEDLARQNRLWQLILDNMGEAVLVADPHGNVLLTNPPARRLFPADVRMAFATAEGPLPADQQPVARCLRGESFDQLDFFASVPTPGEGRWIMVTGRPLVDPSGHLHGAVLVARDMTNRRRIERHRQMQYAVARAIAESETLSECARRVLQHLCEGLGMDVGVLWTIGAKPDALECLEMWNPPELEPSAFVIHTRRMAPGAGNDLPGRVWLSREPAWQSPVKAEFDSRADDAREVGLVSVCSFPVQRGSQTIGVLGFWSRKTFELDEEFRNLVLSIGSLIGQAFERQRIEKALRDSEALYESLVESLPQNIFRKDPQGRFVYANRRFCQIVGRPASEILGKTDFDLFPREMASKYVGDDHRVFETCEPIQTVEEHRLPNGKRLYVEVVKTVVFDALGQKIGVQGIFWDVTEKWLAEELLAESEKRYRQLTEATLDAIVLTDEKNRVLLFNPAAELMFGHRAAELLGQPAAFLISDDFQRLHDDTLSEFSKTGAAQVSGKTREMFVRRKDGTEFPVEIALSVMSAGEGPVHFLAAIRDVTERTKMRATLIQNEKLASIGLLSAGVAHEINNPLSFVSNNLAVLQRDCLAIMELVGEIDKNRDRLAPEIARSWQKQAEEIDLPYLQENFGRLLVRTRDGVDRVSRIVHSLRGMARTEAPRRQDVNLGDLIDGALEILRGKYKHSGIMVVQEHESVPRISCVSTQISQVILNLLVNAYQALESARREGGRIVIRTRRVGSEMLLEVEDNGPGIGAEVMPRIFDPFFTTKDVGEGTGLGLSISHHIVGGHGGRIEVESTPGAGACFRVWLPVTMPGGVI
jgi:PAS domain S-box-containing protein